ncbi:DUF1638 domain-containing protein [Methanolobus bombayensis]|uniref:DUF1638 domain-containing protein n=1 Tax=Methanolobus bombayensis TaxID=38023 RepID=UPI001AE818DA|nr:DUF1638 domain-containing protein [Methanolobus bombayensis]MBP1909211.1 hypothetical protein [Methanolobus bombayensis]
MLEDELVYVLSKDLEIKNLFVVENKNSLRFIQKLKSENLKPFVFSSDRLYPIVLENNRRSSGRFIKLFSDIPTLRQIYDSFNRKKQQKLTVVVNLLRKDLHSDIDHLQSEVYLNAREISKISDGILLFYGKCGYSSEKVQDDLQGLDCPVYFLRDDERNVVDDCVSVALGGNDVYTKTMLLGNGRGAIYATPMWLSSMNETDYKSTESYQNAKKYLSSPMYCLLFKINNHNYKDNNFHRNASEFATLFDMEIINTDGTMDIAINSYMEAKTSIYKNMEC